MPAEPAELDRNDVTAVTGVKPHVDRFADGKVHGRWSAGRANTGALVFDGPQSWYHANGKPAWEVGYRLGRKTGIETAYDIAGTRLWQRDHKPDGRSIWTRWWPNGRLRSISHWHGQAADGRAQTWDEAGALLSDVVFANGHGEGAEGAAQ